MFLWFCTIHMLTFDGSTILRWALSMDPLIATREITEFYLEGSRLNELEKKGDVWSTTETSPRYPSEIYMQNGVKTRFEHMYLQLWNFHRGVDLNILTSLTMPTRIISIGKSQFEDDHQLSTLILN